MARPNENPEKEEGIAEGDSYLATRINGLMDYWIVAGHLSPGPSPQSGEGNRSRESDVAGDCACKDGVCELAERINGFLDYWIIGLWNTRNDAI